ncbi:hypothetical protein CBR_g60778, partial [Chara braunii]
PPLHKTPEQRFRRASAGMNE